MDEDRIYNFSGQPRPRPDTMGGSIYPLVLEESGRDQDSWNDRTDLTMRDVSNSSEWVNGTVTLDHRTVVCVISQNLGYTVFSTVGAFYLPLAFIVAVYLNVYRVARSRIHRRQFNRRRDDDRSGAPRDASTLDPDIETTMQPNSIVLRALRSRLSAISLGLPSTTQPSASGTSMPLQRVSSWNYGGTGGTATSGAGAGRSQQPQPGLASYWLSSRDVRRDVATGWTGVNLSTPPFSRRCFWD